jgi:hypothetical protein
VTGGLRALHEASREQLRAFVLVTLKVLAFSEAIALTCRVVIALGLVT